MPVSSGPMTTAGLAVSAVGSIPILFEAALTVLLLYLFGVGATFRTVGRENGIGRPTAVVAVLAVAAWFPLIAVVTPRVGGPFAGVAYVCGVGALAFAAGNVGTLWRPRSASDAEASVIDRGSTVTLTGRVVERGGTVSTTVDGPPAVAHVYDVFERLNVGLGRREPLVIETGTEASPFGLSTDNGEIRVAPDGAVTVRLQDRAVVRVGPNDEPPKPVAAWRDERGIGPGDRSCRYVSRSVRAGDTALVLGTVRTDESTGERFVKADLIADGEFGERPGRRVRIAGVGGVLLVVLAAL